jgi:hypothetical protein
MHTEYLWGNLNERCQLKDLSADGRIILKQIIKRYDGRMQD